VAYNGAPDGLDPVRIQKGLFLFAEEAPVPLNQKYSFEPYNYGPMSKAIYADLDDLVMEGLLEQVPVKGQTWSRYKPSLRGIEAAHKLIPGLEVQPARQLFDIKQSVANMTFESLLDDVYERYPEHATRSVFLRRA